MKERVKDLIKDKNLRTKLENIIRKIGEEFEPGNVGDTLQGFQHFETVDKNLANIIAKTGKDVEFSDMDLFLLGASPYLHDLFKPSSAWGFLSHGGKVMEAVTDKPELYGLDDRAEAIAIGWISAAHSSRSLDNTEWGRVPEKYAVGSEEVNLRELAAIFLLADTLDTITSRAPEMLSHIHYPEKFPDEKTEGKWMARQAITGWYIKEEKMVLQAHPKGFDEREAVLGAKTLMERDLSEVKPLLKSLGFPCEFELEMEVIFLKEKAIAEIQESRPFKGMDFYDEGDTGLFKGRKGDVGRVEDHIYAYPITLLAGSSGVGKTSLIHAGLFPKLKIAGWVCIYLRPFDDLYRMVKSIKRIYSVEAESLGEAFRNLDEKLKKKILVVIDQFEDVLNWHAEIFEELILDFCSIHGLENPKLLVVLRSDALCDLNRKIFKKVMTNGFPTVELGGLGGEGAREALNAGFKAGKMVLHPLEFIDEILNDLIDVSPFDEVYPPYLQMVGEELCKHADEKRKLILKNAYYELGRARGIVARYLFRKLDEFGEDKENAIKILKSLVSYAGGKTQKSVSEIGAETGIPRKEFKELLKRLVNERMIRKLDGAIYEIIHDHFGELINKELVGEKERHIKYPREQLNAAIAAFERNKALMHCQILAELYRYRKEIPVDKSAYNVLLATWCVQELPAWYWLRNVGNKRIIEIATELCEHPLKEVKEGASDLLTDALIKDGNLNVISGLLTQKNEYIQEAAVNAIAELGSKEDMSIVIEMLKDENEYVQEAAVNAIAELGSKEDMSIVIEMLKDENEYIQEAAVNAFPKLVRREDMPIVIEMLKDENEYIQEAAVNAFPKLVRKGDLPIVKEMLKDEREHVRKAAVKAIAELGSKEDLPLIREMLKDDDWNVRATAIYAIAELGSRVDLPLIRELLKDDDWLPADMAFAKLVRREDMPIVREMLKDENGSVYRAAADAFPKLVRREDMPIIREMLKDENWNVREAAVNAIAELGSKEDIPIIREMLKDMDKGVRKAAVNAFVKLGSEEDLDRLAEISAETCAIIEEPIEALGRLDWKLYSPF